MDVIVEILRPIAKILADYLTRKLRYLISSNKYVDEMRVKIDILRKKRDEVNEHIDKHNILELEITQDVRNWLDAAEKAIVIEVPSDNDIGCSDIRKKYIIGKVAFNAAKRIGDVIDSCPGTSWDRIPIPHGHVYSSTSAPSASSGGETKSDYDSRDKPFKEALKFLQQDDTTQVIALCGMGGVGKTTMMERLRKHAEDKKMFDRIVKAVIGRERDIFSVQNDIADHTGEPLKEQGVIARAETLGKRFENMSNAGKKVLVILDDVWGEVELKNIGLASPLPNRVKLMLTSRSTDVCEQIAAGLRSHIEVVKVEVLVEVEAQNLFSSITEVSEIVDRDLYNIGCDIVQMCGGLPFAINHIAKNLKFKKEPVVWRSTRQRLKRNELDNNVKRVIEMSYEDIGEKEREIFQLCGLYPEDFNIPIEILTRYAWGLRLFKEASTLGDVRDETETCVRNLKSANLLMDSDSNNYVKMHDLVLAFVLGTVYKGEDAWIVDHSDKSKWSEVRSESCKRMSLSCVDWSKFPSGFRFPKLSVLKLDNGYKSLMFPLDFYEEMKNLEVIEYERLEYPLLPTSFQCPNLRMLCLDQCSLPFDYSCIGDLSNLEVLSFANSIIRKLPSTFRNLTKLRLLDITNCSDLVIDVGVFGYLCHLEELYMISSYDFRGISLRNCNYEELATLSKNLSVLEIEFFNKDALPKNMLFEKLKRFKIAVGCRLPNDVKVKSRKSDKGSYENTLMLVTSKDKLLESRMNEFCRKTVHLHLEIDNMKNLEDANIHLPSQNSSFHNLRSLVISKCGNLEYLFTLTVATTLRNVETLVIAKCPVMEAIIHINEDNGAQAITFPKLRSLRLDDLPKLSCLCDNANVIKLPCLLKLVLSGLRKITRIYHKNEELTISSNISTVQQFFNEQVDIHEPEELDISDMENLEEIWPREYISNEDSKLRSIEVTRCERLVNLFPSNPMLLLHHLEELKVDGCASIETLFDINMDKVSKIEDGISSALRRIKVRNCEGLVNLFPSNPVPLLCHLEELEVYNCAFIETLFDINMDKVSQIEDYSSILRRIEVSYCDRLVSLFPSNPMPLLCRLEELVIKYCASVETLFNINLDRVSEVEGNSSMLRRIKVYELGRLREIWRVKGLDDQGNIVIDGFQAVESISISSCQSFENVFTPGNVNFNMGALVDIQIFNSGECKSTRELEVDVAFPSCFMHNFHHLHKIKLQDCEGVEVVFEIESGRSKELAKTQPQLLLPNLTEIELTGMEKMTHVWNCNWNDFLICQKQPEMLFRSLTAIKLIKCNNIKYLFSPLMVKLLSNLKSIEIGSCDCIEEVVSNKDGINDEEMPISPPSSTQKITTFFPLLDSLTLVSLSNLKRIDGSGGGKGGTNEVSSINRTTPTSIKVSQLGVVSWSLCQNSRKISIRSCDKLSSVVPSYALGQMQKLEVIHIHECISMIEVFETVEMNEIAGGSSNNFPNGSSGTDNSLESSRPKIINVPQLLHLKEVQIDSCDLLQHVFTFSALECLKKLEKLSIRRCRAMKVIVKEENGVQTQKDVVFPRLISIELVSLPNLEGFFLGKNDFLWKSLESVKIYDCPRIRLFTIGQSTTPKLNFIHTDLGKHVLENGLNYQVTTNLDQTQFPSLSLGPTATSQVKPTWSFHNLVDMDVAVHYGKHIIPSNEVPRLQKLENIKVIHSYKFEELFELGTDSGGFNETSCAAVEIPNLREMELFALSDLKYIWKSTQWAVLKFPNLKKLSIDYCYNLKHVFTCSMAGSLSQLQEMKLKNCYGLEVIVKEEEEECDRKVKESITLPCLKSLELHSLSSLKGFCLGNQAFSLPRLDTLKIKKCPALTVFTEGHLSTPKLNAIETKFGRAYVREDLNSCIKTIQQEEISDTEEIFYMGSDMEEIWYMEDLWKEVILS